MSEFEVDMIDTLQDETAKGSTDFQEHSSNTNRHTESESSMEEYHQYIFQSIMCQGILNQKQAKDLNKTAAQRYGKKADSISLERALNIINNTIRSMNMEIRKAKNEENGASNYVLVFRFPAAILKTTTAYTTTEYAFIKQLIDMVIDSENGYVRWMNVLNDNSVIEKLDITEALLERLALEKWIHVVDGNVFLGTRLLAELDSYILNQYKNYALECVFCKHVCIRGYKCNECYTRIHLHCFSKLFENVENPCCPKKSCDSSWSTMLQEMKFKVKNTHEDEQEEPPAKRRR